MTTPSPGQKLIARTAAAAFGTAPHVDRYWDDRREASVDILSCNDSPWEGVTSYATIGVSAVPLRLDGKELDVRTELVGACATATQDFGKILSTAAFCAINSGWLLAPGVILPDVLAMYGASRTLKHLLLLPPFLWEDKLQTISVDGKPMAWLLVIPISEAELKYAEARGVPALEALFEQQQIDLFDLERPSVVK